MSKICSKCLKEVDDDVNFCPYCKNNSFRQKQELTVPNNDIVHKVFYWPYSEGSALSKTKIATIAVFTYLFLLCFIPATNIGVIIPILIITLITFLIGFALHKIIPSPPVNKIKHNDYGLIVDLKHLFFYWQDSTGGYIISKTKIISAIIFLGVFVLGLLSFNITVIFGAILLGIIIEIPAFLIGFLIHKLTLKDTSKHTVPAKKVQKPKPVKKIQNTPRIIPEYVNYQMKLDELNSNFIIKEKSTRKIIEKRFEPPQLTYTRFITGVDKSKELFNKNLNSALTMINLADEYSPRIAGEIESKISILTSINEKLEDLANELVLNDEVSKKEDVDNLMGDMDNLIDSVKDYE